MSAPLCSCAGCPNLAGYIIHDVKRVAVPFCAPHVVMVGHALRQTWVRPEALGIATIAPPAPAPGGAR